MFADKKANDEMQQYINTALADKRNASDFDDMMDQMTFVEMMTIIDTLQNKRFKNGIYALENCARSSKRSLPT